MLKGGTARNEITGNSFSGCRDAVHVCGLTTDRFMAPGSGGKEAYGNVITDNNLCGGNTSVYLFDGEKRRQDNTIKGNACNGAGDGLDITGNDPGPDLPPLTSRDDVPKVPLPANTAAKADYQKSLSGLLGARKTLAQATATKLPSMSMESLRQQIAAKNQANCN
jgi:hypothetical protein